MNATGNRKISDPVTIERIDDGVAVISLNRPEAANAMNLHLLMAFHAALLKCHGTRAVRAVVVRGLGRNFCAGGDVNDFLAHGDRLPDHVKEVSSWFQAVTAAIIALDVPVIAAVHGYATGGGGLGLVGSCDFVLAAQTAKFKSGAIGVGMVPDGGLTVTLTHLVGFRKAVELILANPTLDADEAMRIGLVTRVVPDDELFDEALALAHSLAQAPPVAVAEAKRLLWNGLGSGVAAALIQEANAEVRLARTADCLEGLSAAVARRSPVFDGR
ncbi:enoyl-CoA hydratase/isomerase family protein [Mycolicibacterium sphagni]|uniref:enoyl-CoA hydratase/isomerase family protein n=1 Tax=Mycolicibacterium sphagni TaxID=1786 RepID=UPI0021F26005|nr:enoyl-CoA hydratase-related protein [Mycolicibacterium sphagni]MCV7177821.1 enoyl-CoA hydratase/isomerase family protein [Mycolicibacterium sphagni]